MTERQTVAGESRASWDKPARHNYNRRSDRDRLAGAGGALAGKRQVFLTQFHESAGDGGAGGVGKRGIGNFDVLLARNDNPTVQRRPGL